MIQKIIFIIALSFFGISGQLTKLHPDCGSEPFFFTPNGNIYSHRKYESKINFKGNMFCSWLIQSSPGSRIVLQSIEFDLTDPTGQSCKKDKLIIFEVENINQQKQNQSSFASPASNKHKQIGLFCGTKNFRIVSKSNKLLIKFEGRSVDQHKGFKLRYASIRNQNTLIQNKNNTRIDKCNPSYEWQCPQNLNTEKICILKKWRCDGYDDCLNYEDELHCFGQFRPNKMKEKAHLNKYNISVHNSDNTNNNEGDDDWGRVVNGQQTAKGSWPFIASLRLTSTGKHVCGGSLVSDLFVMTAAHCVYSFPEAQYWYVDLGRFYKNGESSVLRIPVEKVHIHPAYDTNTMVNDISLLKLKEKVDFNKHKNVRLVSLAESKDLATKLTANTQCLVAGWGDTRSSGSNSALRQANVPVVDYNLCKSWYPIITSVSFCAGYQNVGVDSCQGDSGGPLMCYVNGQTIQAGIVSWGSDCAQPKQPGVYTNVAAFYNWYSTILN